MNTISLTPTTRVAPDVGLANALARKALECVTSMGFNIALGIVAMACALPWFDTGEYAAVMVAAVATKQPVEELAMIDRILDKIKLLDAEHLELFGLEPTTGEAEKWLRRKAIVEKKIK